MCIYVYIMLWFFFCFFFLLIQCFILLGFIIWLNMTLLNILLSLGIFSCIPFFHCCISLVVFHSFTNIVYFQNLLQCVFRGLIAMSKYMDILKIFKAECTSPIHFNFLLYFYLSTVGLCWLSILFYFILFYFIFKLYIIVLVLPNIKMNPPQVYMCSPS